MQENNYKRKFSIRKLTVGVVSATIGLSLVGASEGLPTVQAQEHDCSLVLEQPKVHYHYVDEEQLTPEQRTLLRPSSDFHLEVADQHATYVLVYQDSKGLIGLPNTGEASTLLVSLLGALGIGAVILTIKGRGRSALLTVTVATGLVLSAHQVAALEQAMTTFLQETYTVAQGHQLPQPDQQIGQRSFKGYFVLDKAELAVICPPAQPAGAVQEAQATNTTPTSSVEEEAIVEQNGAGVTADPLPEYPVDAVPVEQNGAGVTTDPLPEYPVDEVPVEQNGEGVTSDPLPEYPVDEVPVEQNGAGVTTDPLPEYPVDAVPVEQNGVGVTADPLPEYPVDEVPVEQNGSGVTADPLPEYPVDAVPVEQNGEGVTSAPLPEYPVDEVPVEQNGSGVTADPLPEYPVNEVPVEQNGSGVTADPLPEYPVAEVPVEQNGVGVTADPLPEYPVAAVPVDQNDGSDVPIPSPVQPLIETRTESIPFSVIEENDPQLWEGETVTRQVGQAGLIRYTLTDGVADSGVILQEPIPQIIVRGSRPVAGSRQATMRQPIPFGQEEQGDPDLWAGDRRVIQEGQEGEQEVTTTYETLRGEDQPNPTVTTTVIRPALPQITAVGTKPVVGQAVVVTEESLDFETVRQADPSRWEDSPLSILVAGEKGLSRLVTVYETLRDQPTDKILDQRREVLKSPVQQVEQVGTKPINGEERVEREEEVPFELVVLPDPDRLPSTPDQIVQEGVVGRRLIVELYKTVRGERVGDPISQEERLLQAATNQVVKRGTKVLTQAELNAPQALEQTVFVNDQVEPSASLVPSSVPVPATYAWKPDTAPRTSQSGRQSAVVLVTYGDGSIDEVPVTITVQDKVTSRVERLTTALDFQTREELTDQLDKGERRTVRTGVKGQVIIERTFEVINGVETGQFTDKEISRQDPVDELIEVGTKEKQADLYAPQAQLQEVAYNGQADPAASVVATSASQVSSYTWKPGTAPQTNQSGDQAAVVLVTYEDGTIDEVAVTVRVLPSQASANTPQAQKQRVAQGDDLVAERSLVATSAQNVRSVAWKPGQEPSTASYGLDKPGVLLVTYEDGSTDDLPVTVDVLVKPTLTLTSLVEDDEAGKVVVNYQLDDPTQTYQAATARIYQGTTLVRELPLDKLRDMELTNLDYNVPYTLETVMTYDISKGTETEVLLDRRPFELTLKKIEFRHVVANELYRVDQSGQLERINGLTEVPADLSSYVVKIRTSKNKDIYLPISQVTPAAGDTFAVTASHPELVQFQTNTDKTEGYTFTIDKTIVKPGAYAKFEELVAAMAANPNGDFYLAADMLAPATADAAAYLTVPFRGSLSSADESKRFAIRGLNKPLFASLDGARVSNIALTDVAINTAQENVGALAKEATNATIRDVEVRGGITAKSNIGGLVYRAVGNTSINQVTADVTLRNTSGSNTQHMGGLVGLQIGGRLDNSKAQVTIPAQIQSFAFGSTVGGLVGTSNGVVSNSYASGTITPSSDAGYYGGLVGRTTFLSELANSIAGVNVSKGGQVLGLDGRGLSTNNATISGQAAGDAERGVPAISPEEAQTRSQAWGARPVASAPSTPQGNSSSTSTGTSFDFSSLPSAKPGYQLAYENMEKLLPYYDRHTIVKYGNKVDPSSKLFTTQLLSAVPMVGRDFVTNTLGDQPATGLFLHFADNTKEEVALTAQGNFKATNIKEYSFGNGLLYTPEQFTQVSDQVVKTIVDSLMATPELTRTGLINLLGIKDDYMFGGVSLLRTKEAIADNLLYLQKPLTQLKANLENEVRSLISSYASIDLTSEALGRYLTQEMTKDKEKLLLGLAMLHRSYNVSYGDHTIQDLMKYRPDFEGKKADVLDYVTAIGQDYHALKGYESVKTYADKLAGKVSEAKTLTDFLEKRRALFLPDKTNSQWFKENSKAFIHEQPSKDNPALSVDTYEKLKTFFVPGDRSRGTVDSYPFAKFILPLLALPEEDRIVVISTISTLQLGHYGYLVEPSLLQTNPDRYAAEVERAKTETIPARAKELGAFLDFWSRMAKPELREKLNNPQTIVNAGFRVIDNSQTGPTKLRWLKEFGDEAYSVVDDFFGIVELYTEYKNQSAVANGRDTVTYLGSNMLSQNGVSTMTHELTHNYDQSVLLDGHGRRFGNGAESYAMGMLQSPSSVNDYYLGLNTAFEFTNAVHNASPNRFKTREDLQTYMRGVMDVAYTMDLLELEALRESSGSADAKRNLFFQMVSVNPQTVTENGVSYTHYDDELKPVTADVWEKINSLSIDALIDNDIMMKDATNAQGAKVYDRSDASNYTHIHLAAPIYGGLSNDKGVVGGLQARRTAFELLAAKGWDKGYLPYATNQYKAEAEGQGRPLSDTYIFDKVLGQGVTYKAFKKAEYATAEANKSRLKGVTVTFQGQNHVINTADDLKALFARAVANDLTARPGNNLQRRELRLEVMRAYNKLTEDFSNSIYR